MKQTGLPLSVLGLEQDNARAFWNWLYMGNIPDLPATRAALENTCDMRLVPSLTTVHLDYIAGAVINAIQEIAGPE